MSGGSATESVSVTGLLATDLVFVSLADNGANEDLQLLEGKAGADAIALLFNEDPVAGAKVNYGVYR